MKIGEYKEQDEEKGKNMKETKRQIKKANKWRRGRWKEKDEEIKQD